MSTNIPSGNTIGTGLPAYDRRRLPQDNPLVYALSLTLFRVTFNHTKEPVEPRYEPEVPTTFVPVNFDACDTPGVGDVSGRNLEKIGEQVT